MLDVREQLRRYTESAVERVSFEDVVTVTSDRPFDAHRRWLARPVGVATATALALLIIVGGAAWIVSTGQSDSAAEPSSSVSISPALDTLVWERVETPGLAGPYLYFNSVIAGGPGLIAVGSGDPGMVWTSADGTEWVPAAVEDDAWAVDVVAGGPGYVAVGPGIWTSDDGSSWSAALLDGTPRPRQVFVGGAQAVTVGGPGLVAVGIHEHALDQERAVVWTSADGIDWSRVPHDETVFGNSQMFDVVAGGPGLIAVGVNHGTGSAAVWTSVDGIGWSRVPHDPAVFGDGVTPTEMLSVASGESGLVAVASIGDNGMGVWTSPDGTSWSAVVLDPAVFDGDEEMSSVIAVGDGFLAVGLEGDDAAAWSSHDGTTWTRLNDRGALGGTGHQRISGITPFDDGFVAVGSDYPANTEAVWIARPRS